MQKLILMFGLAAVPALWSGCEAASVAGIAEQCQAVVKPPRFTGDVIPETVHSDRYTGKSEPELSAPVQFLPKADINDFRSYGSG